MPAPRLKSSTHYRRITELGRGGMATIYLTSLEGPQGFEKLVVVKEMRGDLADDPEFRRMFLEEARVAASLDHPNVVQTHEVFESAGVFAIVMEFLDGQPLSKLRASARREVILPLQLYVCAQALAGLAHVHAAGLVHRDVSPQNLFVTYDGDVKILDFGIVKTADSSVHTEVGTLKGKLGYMAPEQVMGKRIDQRTDVFAMGVVLWEALTGTRLWANVPEPAIVGRLTAGSIPSVRSIKSDVPEELSAICARAIQADPADRYPTADEFREALEAFITKITVPPTRRDLANLMKSLFVEQRERLRVVIDRALSNPSLRSEELLVGLSALPHLPRSGLTVPPTAVTVRFAKPQEQGTGSGVVATPKGESRRRQTIMVGTLALAATLAVGIAIGVVARRPAAPTAETPSASPALGSLSSSQPSGTLTSSASPVASVTTAVAPLSSAPPARSASLPTPRASVTSSPSNGRPPAIDKPRPRSSGPQDPDLGY